MLETLLNLIPSKKARNVAMTAGGMVALLGGRKLVGLGLFAKGAHGLEQCWREEHPDFQGGLAERWQRAIKFYEATHSDPMNRKLHIVGIPIILGGTAGLLIFRPYRPLWFISAGAFAGGWALNIVGHAVFEKNAPAFADDPLSFLAGPIWDWQQVKGKRQRAPAASDEGEVVNMPPAESQVV
ncbi:MAG: DUF962 domain-containing protein [Myxococcota bacterium]